MLILVNNFLLIKVNHGYFYFTDRDPELVKRIGAATALEVRATGIQYVYAPCVAVSNCNQLLMLSTYTEFLALSYTLNRFVEIQDGVGVMKATVKILK